MADKFDIGSFVGKMETRLPKPKIKLLKIVDRSPKDEGRQTLDKKTDKVIDRYLED